MDNTASTAVPAQKIQRPSRPNYNVLHARPLPIKVYPLPPLIPHNPISIVHIACTYIRQIFFPPSSRSITLYYGYFSPETRSVHVTDEVAVRAFWENGFFGKGSLSRSEPTWLDREKRRKGLIVDETSEEVTRRRRGERKAFKKERARKERENIELKLKAEQGLATSLHAEDGASKEAFVEAPDGGIGPAGLPVELNLKDSVPSGPVPIPALDVPRSSSLTRQLRQEESQIELPSLDEVEIIIQEHLQLDLCEAFFLTYALDAITILAPTTHAPIPVSELLLLFVAHASFPPLPHPLQDPQPEPDNPFLLSYVAYHHFRSLGWVVRSGVKFAVDFLLYNRGPVFSHAEFAIVIVPAYSHTHWKHGEGNRHVEARGRGKQWHWLHMVNRVQSQVKKTLVLCFVEVPPPSSNQFADGEVKDVGKILRRYKVRELVLKRWIPNRSRD